MKTKKAKRPFPVRLPSETIEALRGVAAVLTAVGGKRATASSAARHLIERGLLEYVAGPPVPATKA